MQCMFISSTKLVGWLFVSTNVNMDPMISQVLWKVLHKTTMGWKHTKVEYFLTYVESILVLK